MVSFYIKKKKLFWLEKVLTLSADYRFSCGRNAGIKLHKHWSLCTNLFQMLIRYHCETQKTFTMLNSLHSVSFAVTCHRVRVRRIQSLRSENPRTSNFKFLEISGTPNQLEFEPRIGFKIEFHSWDEDFVIYRFNNWKNRRRLRSLIRPRLICRAGRLQRICNCKPLARTALSLYLIIELAFCKILLKLEASKPAQSIARNRSLSRIN